MTVQVNPNATFSGTLSDLRRVFLEHLAGQGESERNVAAHGLGVDRFAEYLDSRPPEAASPSDLEGFLSYLSELGVTASSLKTYRTVVERWIAFMDERREELPEQPSREPVGELDSLEADAPPAPPTASREVRADADGNFSTLMLRGFRPPVTPEAAAKLGVEASVPVCEPEPTTPMMSAIDPPFLDAGSVAEQMPPVSDRPSVTEAKSPAVVGPAAEPQLSTAPAFEPLEPEPTSVEQSVIAAPGDEAAFEPLDPDVPAASDEAAFEPLDPDVPAASDEPAFEPLDPDVPAASDEPAFESLDPDVPAASDEAAFEPLDPDVPAASDEPAFEPLDPDVPAASDAPSFESLDPDVPAASDAPAFEPLDPDVPAASDAPAFEPLDPDVPAASDAPSFESLDPDVPAASDAPASDLPAPIPAQEPDTGERFGPDAAFGASAEDDAAVDVPVFGELGDSLLERPELEDPSAEAIARDKAKLAAPPLPSLESAPVAGMPGETEYEGGDAGIPLASQDARAPDSGTAAKPDLSAPPREMGTQPGTGKWRVRRAAGERDDLSLDALITMAVAGELAATDLVRKPNGEWAEALTLRPLRRALGLEGTLESNPAIQVREDLALGRAAAGMVVAGLASGLLWWFSTLAVGVELVPLSIVGGLFGGIGARLAARRADFRIGLVGAAAAPMSVLVGRYLVYETVSSGVALEGLETAGSFGSFFGSGLGVTQLVCLGLGALAGLLMGSVGNR